MVFQSALSFVLNKYLGEFVENLDEKQLNVGIWGGDIELKNLVIKPAALDELDLPVQCVYGKIGKLVLKIPWKSLYTERTIITVEDVYLLAHPNQQVKYDAEKEEKKKLDYKLKEIDRIQEAKRIAEEKLSGKAPAKQGWTADFAEKLVTTIIKNLQLNINRIHIRYEDKVTNSQNPFGFGITLEELAVESTDSNWKTAITDDIVKIFKILHLKNLGVYLNCRTQMYAGLPIQKMLEKLQSGIATVVKVPEDFQYVLGPINASARLKMNQKPGNDDPPYSLPKFHLNLQMETIFVGINKCQYQDLIALADSMGRMERGLPFRKFRPNVETYKGHAREWWHFAIDSVLEYEVRRKQRNWDWKYIKEYRDMCKDYKQLFAKKAIKKGLKGVDEIRYNECEKRLDLTNLIIIREQVQAEVKRESVESEKKGWFGWMWSGSQSKDSLDEDKIVTQIKKEMTPEEKQQLYKAIDFQENAAPAIYPDEFVDVVATFLLKTFIFEMNDVDEKFNLTPIFRCNLDSVRCKMETRPTGSGLAVKLKVDDLIGIGYRVEDHIPYLISSETTEGELLDIKFEINPLDKTCDQRLILRAQPLRIVYDALTINKIVEVFTIPPDASVSQLQDAAMTRITEIKEMSTLGLQYAVEKRQRFDINIDFRAPYFILPYGGKYTGSENVIVVDLGNFKMYTYGRRSTALEVRHQFDQGKTQEEIFEYMLSHSYDKFKLELLNLQVLVAQSEEDWKLALMNHTSTSMHLVQPLTLEIIYSKCLITDDPRMPLGRVDAEIPSAEIVVSDARLMLAIALVASINFPGEDAPEGASLTKTYSSTASLMSLYKEVHIPDVKQLSRVQPETKPADQVEFTILLAKFVMSRISITLNKQELISDTAVQMAKFSLNSISCEMKQMTFLTEVEVKLSDVQLEVDRDSEKVKILETPKIEDRDSSLFRFVFTQVDPKCPDIHSLYSSCEKSLGVTFGSLNVTIHKEGILTLLKFYSDINDNVTAALEDKSKAIRFVSSSQKLLSRTASTASSLNIIGDQLKLPKRKSRRKHTNETVKFKIDARLEEVSVKFCSDAKEISKVSISKVNAVLITKETYMQINASLGDISVRDLNKHSVHKQILSRIEGEALTAQVVINVIDEDDVNCELPNMDVKVQLGRMRILFLNWYITNMLNFMNQFQVAQEAIMNASSAAAQAAKENITTAYAKAEKMALDINLKAPYIMVPIDSRSYDVLLLDLGVITIKNKFLNLDVKNDDGFPAVVDDLTVALKKLKISRAVVDHKYNVGEELIILQPTNFDLSIKRNLSIHWFHSIPDMDVSGKVPKIQIVVSNVDYQGIMLILNGNLAEGVVETVLGKESETIQKESLEKVLVSFNPDMDKAEMAKAIWLGSKKEKPRISLKFTFLLDQFVIQMYYKAGSTIKTGLSRDSEHQFARFSLEGLSLKGRIMTDNSLVTSVLLLRCILDDMRPNREDKLNRLIDRSPEKSTTPSGVVSHTTLSGNTVTPVTAPKSMIDITYQQKENDSFIDVRIFSFTIVVSMDYLLQIADFFTVPPTENISHLMKATDSSVSTKAFKQTNAPQKPAAPTGQMTLNLKLEKPDIILVEHMDHIDAKAVIFSAEILVKLRQSGTHQVVNGIIKECELYRAVFNPAQRPYTKATIIHPFDISLAGSTPPDQGLHVELLVTNIYINVSPQTIELLSKASAAMAVESKQDLKDEKEFNFTDLWQPKPFKEDDYWFLNTEVAGDVLDLLPEPTEIKAVLQELCIVSIPLISVIVEAGDGSKSLPVLIMETGFKGSVKNWSSMLTVEAALTMQMGYYNNKLAMWEPLIEPQVINQKTQVPWELKVEVAMNEEIDQVSYASSLSPSSELENESQLELPKPIMSIGLFSEKNMEVTITKTLLDTLDYLQKAFNMAMDKDVVSVTKENEAPFRVINDLGEDVALILEESSFVNMGAARGDVDKVAVPLQLKPEYKGDEKLHLSKELLGISNKESHLLKIQINRLDSTISLPVLRADKRYFPLNYRTNIHDNWGIICDIAVEEAITTIVLRSVVQVHNHFDVPIDVYYMTSKGNELKLISQVEPEEKLNVPLKAVYTPTTELFFGFKDYCVTAKPFAWKSLQTSLKVNKNLQCFPKNMEKENIPFIIQVMGEMEQVYFEHTNRHTMTSTCYNIHLRPAVTFKNSLPIKVVCCVDESPDEYSVEPGDTLQLPTVEPGNNFLVIRIPKYLEKEWSCRKEVTRTPEEFTVWTFDSYDSSTKLALDLGMHIEKKQEAFILTLYCPFWMINKTRLMLGYRSSDDNVNVLYHPANFEGPILFSFSAKNFFGKKKASIRIDNGEWSDKFSIDVAGSSGTVICKYDEQKYEIGVQNKLTYNGLTKQITFMPYYIIINEASFAIQVQESNRPADHWTTVKPKSCSPLWPKDESQDKLMKIRVKGTTDSSAPFLYTESHTTLLKLDNKYGGLNVDIQLTEGGTLINVAPYEDGSAPALLINHSSIPITYWEKESVQKRVLEPNETVLYTWENPSGPRQLVCDRGFKKEIINDLCKDMYGEFSPKEGVYIYWTSFLDGMQRILLFTNDRYLAEAAQASNILEQIQQEITVSIHGIGLSLVNNIAKQEIMYIGVASSGVIWEVSRTHSERYKYLDKKTSDALEAAYQECVRESAINPKHPWLVKVDSKTEVDFKTGQMHRPQNRKIRRTFLTGLWLQMKTSPSQKQIHAKINRLQIDNQLYDCVFPVVLAPVPPPKSVAGDTTKPFIEVSIVQLLMKNSQILQFKYFKVLVQEFHIKLDLGFVNAILQMFSEEEATPEKWKEQFLLDKEWVKEDLYKLAASESIQQQKSFYDLLHFSPLKIHISFSLASASSSGLDASDTPPFLNVLLQGLGVTLTDMNDVIFKLAYFERNFNFLTQNQLISEATKHYVGQAIKQFYVLVLGLDVLGNPYGLVLGISKGVEDLFYEPFQGAIQGPGEFVEGLALGVKSLFGHTVGGAAGAVSKITGAMGKGIAALTFDEEFQRKRREQKNRKPQNVQEGLARGGKGVVMGFYSGVTGVFTKPVEGAKVEGVEGFFKGLGKGAMGLVTRPVAGVVDFASESFDVVKRAAEGNEDTLRLRTPRFFHSDGLVRPYNKAEALGNKYLHGISKGKYAKTDVYIAHYDVVQEKEVLLLTDQRIAYITHSDMFGNWQIEWHYTWDEITMPAKVSPKGVIISTTDKKKKMFASKEFAKMVLIPDPQVREDICEKIESLRTA